MKQKHSTPQLTPLEYKDGCGWYVEATSDGGIAENVGDFCLRFRSQGLDCSKIDSLFPITSEMMLRPPGELVSNLTCIDC
jgi:hypothetical protein